MENEMIAYLLGFPAGIGVIMEFMKKVVLTKDSHEKWYTPLAVVLSLGAGLFATFNLGFSWSILLVSFVIILFEQLGWDWLIFKPLFKKLMIK